MFTFAVPESKWIRVIVDTDAACEADDPFAIVHALLSPKLIVKAVIAEHFASPGSMEKSYAAIQTLLGLMQSTVPALRGEPEPLGNDAPPSEGVRFMIQEARSADARPLFVLCMGAATNIARALAEASDIASKLTVITIGGQPYERPVPGLREFNFGNDVPAANALLASGAQVWQFPFDAYTMMRVGLAELELKVQPCGRLGKYLFTQMIVYNQTEAASWTAGESWSLGDNPSVAAALHPGCGIRTTRPAMKINPDTTYSDQPLGTQIEVYQTVDSRYVLEDLFAKLALHAASQTIS